MAVFEFRGVEVASGKSVKGFRDAENPKALRMVLRRDGILLTQATIEAERVARDKKAFDPFAFLKRPSPRDVSIMTRQLATLVRAGVPLVESVAALTEQVENQQLVRILTTVRESLNAGTSFAKSLEAHPKTFVTLY
ncbi:MAG TPA: type II secretion system F family protein, partial [Polyangiaceae bacterium]|nr:type II secretion system F family protein [Polyangiaceae bacterium]